MKPRRTSRSNMTYKGPNDDIGDLPCQRIEKGMIRSIWQPSSEELAVLNAGGNIELNILTEPIPPVSVNVTYES